MMIIHNMVLAQKCASTRIFHIEVPIKSVQHHYFTYDVKTRPMGEAAGAQHQGAAHQPYVLIDHDTNECIEVETITVKDVKHRPKGEAEADDVKPGASHQLSQPSAESGRTSTSRRCAHSDKHYNIEVDAEWYEQQVEGKPPLLVPPRFITLQIREEPMGDSSPGGRSATPRPKGESLKKAVKARPEVEGEALRNSQPKRFCFEHPMWSQFNKSSPVKYKVDGRRARKGPNTWSSETPLPMLLGGFERPPTRGEKLSLMPKFYLTITLFYSFSDVVALLGMRLSSALIDNLLTGKCIRVARNGWAYLPHVICERTSDGGEAGAQHQAVKARPKAEGAKQTRPKGDGYVIRRQLVVRIRDLFGLEYDSLLSTADAYNIPMPHKGLMDNFKGQMDVPYRDPKLRDQMITYALGDLVLLDLWDAYVQNYRNLCAVSGVTPRLTPPATKGSLVAHLFELVLNKSIPLPDDFRTIFDLPAASAHGRGQSITDLIKLYGCKALASSEDSLTKQFLAIVHGGRVKNEIPHKIRHTGLVISMDIVSAYGQALQHLSLPIGHPVMLYYPHHHPSEWSTLRKVLTEYRHELVEGCWYFVVDTCGEMLTFSQNLLYTKRFKHDQPELLDHSKDSDDFREDLAHVKGDFMLLERELRNGILTHYSLSIIEHCASNQERGELLDKLRVKCAMIYPASLCHEYSGPESVQRWISAARNHTGKLSTFSDMTRHGVEDSRVGPWLKFPLHSFITPYLERRRQLKKEMKEHPRNSQTWRRLNATQLSFKKVVNTLYGTFASIYFPISSPCVANNVTDRCRMGCFSISNAGHSINSVTDGGESLLDSMMHWIDIPPSLGTIALLKMPHLLPESTRRRHFTAPLGACTLSRDNKGWERGRSASALGRAEAVSGVALPINPTCPGMGSLRDSIQKGPHTRTTISDEGAAHQAPPMQAPQAPTSREQTSRMQNHTSGGDAPDYTPTKNGSGGATGDAATSDKRWEDDKSCAMHKGWEVDANGMITGPGLDTPSNADTAIPHIERLYDAHLRQYYTQGGRPLPSWFESIKFECKLIGLDIAVHGSANYAIGPLPRDNRPPLIKSRGHRLRAPHYHPESGEHMESPMLTMMMNRLRGQPMQLRQSAISYKPASVSDYRKRREFRELGGMPGFSIAKRSSVRLITLSEFNFPDLNTRMKWDQYYSYLNMRYGIGLEAMYAKSIHAVKERSVLCDAQGIDSELWMTVEEVEAAKVDIQHKIYSGESPSSIYVPRFIRPLNEVEGDVPIDDELEDSDVAADDLEVAADDLQDTPRPSAEP